MPNKANYTSNNHSQNHPDDRAVRMQNLKRDRLTQVKWSDSPLVNHTTR